MIIKEEHIGIMENDGIAELPKPVAIACTRKSIITGKLNTMIIEMDDPYKIPKWRIMRNPPFVQDYFPELSDDEREFLLNGITPEEWDACMGDER